MLRFTTLFILIIAAVACSGQQTKAQRLPPKAKRTFAPGDIVPSGYLRSEGTSRFFSISPLPNSVFKLMQGRSYKAGCPVSRSDLRYLRCLHTDAKGRTIVGEMVVNKLIAAKVLKIFRKLYEAHYPIERMRLIDYYGADDEASMEADNSSCFNYRRIAHSNKVSKHGLGLAVDINTLYNPYCRRLRNGQMLVQPKTGRKYLDRSVASPYRIEKGDLCHRLFLEAGFTWGGSWRHSKDYQHFEYRH